MYPSDLGSSPARVPLPPSRLPSPGSPRLSPHQATPSSSSSTLNAHRRIVGTRSPLRSSSVPLPILPVTSGTNLAAISTADERVHHRHHAPSTSTAPSTRPSTRDHSPDSSHSTRGRDPLSHLERPAIIRSSTSTQTIIRYRSSVPPPRTRGAEKEDGIGAGGGGRAKSRQVSGSGSGNRKMGMRKRGSGDDFGEGFDPNDDFYKERG